MRWWAAVWLSAAGARVVVHGLERLDAATGYVVVSNHQSNLDPIAHLSALPVSLRILVKRELFQLPVLGWLMRLVEMVAVDRRCADLPEIDDAAARCLVSGHSLLVYPEGTTSPGGSVGAFKNGAFAIAVLNQAPILPVTIHGSCRIWAPGRGAIHPGVVHFVVGRPLVTTGLTPRDVAWLRDQARETIESTHHELVNTLT
ncbi:lysophospholipid acyltransferase family protein [soil metagenome]